MMLPNQITLQNFSQTGKGGYKSVEVDAFLQRVYQSYNKLYIDNKALSEKLDDILPKLEEYNTRKNSIADALIWAKATAEKNIEESKTIADNLVAEANEKAEKLLEDTRNRADAYYADRTVAADEKVKKANLELENIKQQSDIYSERYIAEINVKTQTIIEDANSKAAAIVADAYSDAKKAREKADKIIADANAELEVLKAEAVRIKNEILSLISSAQTAAEKIDLTTFVAVEIPENGEDKEIKAKQIDVEEIEKFTFDGIGDITVDDVVDEVIEEDPDEKPAQPEYVKFFGADMPDVNDLLKDIFTAVNETNSRNTQNEDENSFMFTDIFSSSDSKRSSTQFDPMNFDSIMKDSENTVEF